MYHAGCLGLALLRGLSLLSSGSSSSSPGVGGAVDACCQTSTVGQLEGLNRKLLLLEDNYLGKVGVWGGGGGRAEGEGGEVGGVGRGYRFGHACV